jgi:hypothetical protein
VTTEPVAVPPTLRERLGGAGPPLVATFVLVPRLEVVELLAYARREAAPRQRWRWDSRFPFPRNPRSG